MTITEINNEFDILYENISSGAAPNLNDYEKSLFLTRAQDELVRMYYNGKNSHYSSFESDEETRRYLDQLVLEKTVELSSPQSYAGFTKYTIKKNDIGNMLFVLRETATNASNGCLNGAVMQVIPISHEDLNRVLNDPFKRPNERKVLRYDDSNSDVYFNLLTKHNLKTYTITYLKKPKPIILSDLGEDSGFTIDNQYEQTETLDIPDLLQHKVISRAVELAKAAYIGDLNTTFAINARDL